MHNKLALSVFAAALAAPAMAADSYSIDPNHTLPVFAVSHFGFSTQHGRFDKTAGKISLDLPNKKATVDITIDAGSIDMGLAKWNDHMKSEDFFNVAKFPTISFKSDKFVFKDGKPVAADGDLSLLGVSKPVKLTINHFSCGENPINKKPLCAADIDATLKRSDFGMTKYLPGVGDEIKVTIPVEAYKD